MNTRYFTLAEARATLPKVKQLMQMAQEARQEILRLRPEAWPALQHAALNGGNRSASDVFQHYQRLEAGIKGIMALGILVKDVDMGLIDFVGKHNGRDVYLCWKYGEDDIEYWHEINAGFAGRRPIDGAIQ